MFSLFYASLSLQLSAHRFPIFVVFVLLLYGGTGVLRMKRVKGRSVLLKVYVYPGKGLKWLIFSIVLLS